MTKPEHKQSPMDALYKPLPSSVYNAVKAFAQESNRIEGITQTSSEEVLALVNFISKKEIETSHLKAYVHVIQPDAILRDRLGLNVRVGYHIPPRGGPQIPFLLESILRRAKESDPYHIHCEYETLHPFTDGNGRSGRALWLWMMGMPFLMEMEATGITFLHQWYYQSLQASRDG